LQIDAGVGSAGVCPFLGDTPSPGGPRPPGGSPGAGPDLTLYESSVAAKAIGLGGGLSPNEPTNGRSENEKIPPSAATIR